jgi:type IV pilus assembly protein PilA
MLARLRKAQEEREGGFTLIELLVVIIIIGILAAIAIPVFLNQRKKGYDAAAKSDLKGMQVAEETYLTDNPTTYTTAMTDLSNEGFKGSPATTDSVAGIATNASYCLKSISQSGLTWYLGSSTGGPTQTACSTS